MIKIDELTGVISEQEALTLPREQWPLVTTIMGNDGTLYRPYSMPHDRGALLKIGKVDGMKGKSELDEFIRLLPNDQKIPAKLLHQIISFFRRVMAMPGVSGTSHGDYEAMIHVVWSPEGGYRLAVPKQKVAKASVTYTWDHVNDGEIVVLDMHSHNSMGAFFSGTDNNDDKTAAGLISGVAGTLDKEATFVWRVNFGATKVDIDISDIFEFEPVEAHPDEETWIREQVEIVRYSPTYSYNKSYKGKNTGVNYGNSRWGDLYDDMPVDIEGEIAKLDLPCKVKFAREVFEAFPQVAKEMKITVTGRPPYYMQGQMGYYIKEDIFAEYRSGLVTLEEVVQQMNDILLEATPADLKQFGIEQGE